MRVRPPGSADVLVGTANGVLMGKRSTALFIGSPFAAKEDLGVPGAACAPNCLFLSPVIFTAGTIGEPVDALFVETRDPEPQAALAAPAIAKDVIVAHTDEQ